MRLAIQHTGSAEPANRWRQQDRTIPYGTVVALCELAERRHPDRTEVADDPYCRPIVIRGDLSKVLKDAIRSIAQQFVGLERIIFEEVVGSV
jgi:hypothetical protein